MVSTSMTSRDNEILTQFPCPPGSVLKALELLQVLRRGDPDEMAEYGDLSNLPRPWDPSTCPQDLRAAVCGSLGLLDVAPAAVVPGHGPAKLLLHRLRGQRIARTRTHFWRGALVRDGHR